MYWTIWGTPSLTILKDLNGLGVFTALFYTSINLVVNGT